MGALADLLKARNIPLTIVVYPWAQQIAQGDRDSRQVSLWRDFCPGRCKAFINLYPAFFAAADADRNWYEHLFILGDDHFSAEGNRFMFRELAGTSAVKWGYSRRSLCVSRLARKRCCTPGVRALATERSTFPHEGFCRKDRRHHRRRHGHGPRAGAPAGRRGLQRRDVRHFGRRDGRDQAALRGGKAAAGSARHHPCRRRLDRGPAHAFPRRTRPSSRRPTGSICCSTMPASAAAAACSPTRGSSGKRRSTSAGAGSIWASAPSCRC